MIVEHTPLGYVNVIETEDVVSDSFSRNLACNMFSMSLILTSAITENGSIVWFVRIGIIALKYGTVS